MCCSLGESSCHPQGLVPESAVVGADVSYIHETVNPGFKDGIRYSEMVCDVTFCSTAVKIQNIKVQYEDDNFIRAVKARPQDYALEIRIDGMSESVKPVVEGYVLNYNINTYVTDGIYRFSSSLSLSMKITRWGGISDNDWYNRLDAILINDFYVWSDSTINVMYQLNAAGYPLAQFRLTPNLPPISQIDFINFICNWYGLFPIMDSGMIRLVSFNVLTDNIENGKIYDWSDKLASYSDDAPKSIAYAMDYAQHNSVGYTVDDNDAMRVRV